jgi:Glycosyl transferase family 2
MSAGTVGAPRLTIVIPTLNRAALVGRAVDSALAQTYGDIEVIVSNNGSTDGTRVILDRYDDPRLRIFHRDETIPATSHGNFLLDQARGEFFLGLSDDDWIEPGFVRTVLDLFDRRKELSFVYTGCLIHYGGVALSARTGPLSEPGPEFLAAFLGGRRDVCWCACVARTADLRRIGPIPPGTICGDMFYWTKLAARGEVGCAPEVVSHYVSYRDAGDNHSGGTRVLAWAQEVEALAHDMVAACGKARLNPDACGKLESDSVEFVARSTADQFVWNALRGAGRLSLLLTVAPSFRFLRRGGAALWIRVLASIAAPRWLLRNRVLAAAARKVRASTLDQR